ncbi:hypothetical protein [Rhodopirellula bahusiensis]|uniref:SMI1/KNR4 family protein n=1 Tax=Rhodopirellula bahusiensis TaxID=2014065 RepID=A0A2G1VZT6_9BACT|nr:hypothetical protein [Rhodopirellula bahusiensis]PHQ32120.1 hypothetical protein CEE69_27390 [Rhodopirellula bahusiensis]
MKYEIKIQSIERRVATGFRLPAAFQSFVEVCRHSQLDDLGWFAVKYTKASDLLGFDAGDRVVPFLRLGDGGFVAFWFQTRTSPTIIHCDSEGQTSIAGANFADFLLRLTRRKSSVPDIDEREGDQLPEFKRLPKRVAPIAKKQKELKAWLKQNRPEELPADEEAESIRQELCKVLASDMAASIRESEKLLGHKLTADDDFPSTVDMIAHLTKRSYKITTIGGQPFPRPQRLRKVFDRLVDWLGHSLKSCEISVWSDGRVFVDKNICLGNPPKRE